MTSLLLAVLGLALVAGALVLWFRRLRQVALGGHRAGPYGLIALGALCAVAALATDAGLVAGLLAGTVLVVAAGWSVLGALALQSRQEPAVAVGERLPDFTARDHRGEPFRMADLRGQPVLLKLFRGHW